MNTAELISKLESRFGRVIVRLHNGLAVIGLIAIVLLLAQVGRYLPLSASALTSAEGTIRFAENSLFVASDEVENLRYKTLARYLARRYRVANDATEQMVAAAHEAGQLVGLDPLLILAVMAIESRFNPIAESVMGAKGLMQVMPQQHQDKFSEHGGQDAVLDPSTNIFVGARILKDCVRRAGSLESGLQLYAGAFNDPSNQYALKVLAEKDRIAQALRRTDPTSPRPGQITASLGPSS